MAIEHSEDMYTGYRMTELGYQVGAVSGVSGFGNEGISARECFVVCVQSFVVPLQVHWCLVSTLVTPRPPACVSPDVLPPS